MSTSVVETRAENGGSDKVSMEDNKSDNIQEAESNGTMDSGLESALPVKVEKEANTAEQQEKVLNAEEKLTSTEDNTLTQKPIDNDLNNKESLETKKNNESQSSNIEKPAEEAPTTTESEVEKPTTELTDQKIEKCVEDKKPVLEKEVEKTDEEKMDVEKKKDEEEKKEKDSFTEISKDVGKKGLPKWMVQSANAPPSPSPELGENIDEKQTETAAPLKRRGRGRRSMAEKSAEEKQKQINDGEEGQSEEALSPRPRRSTRSRVDYANPDPMTVVAEADDDEPGSGAKRITRNAPGRKPIVGRGRKRKGTSSDDEDGGHVYDDDDDEDYGSKKRVAKKRSNAGGAIGTPASGGRKRGRGRPASGIKSAGKPPTKGRFPRGGVATKRNIHDNDSDEEHSDVVYDDGDSDKEPTSDDDSTDEKQSEEITPIIASKTTQMKAPLKKRGRPPAGARNQKQSVSNDAKDHLRSNDSNDDG